MDEILVPVKLDRVLPGSVTSRAVKPLWDLYQLRYQFQHQLRRSFYLHKEVFSYVTITPGKYNL